MVRKVGSGRSLSNSKVVEGYRVLTLTYPLAEDVKQYIDSYRAYASHLYWCKRLGMKYADNVVSSLKASIKSYWYDNLLYEGDPLYLFKNVRNTPRPYKVIIDFPLVDALYKGKGAYIEGDRLIVKLNRKLELKIPDGARRWLEERLGEGPASKFVRITYRGDRLIVQIVLHKRAVVKKPTDPLLVVVDVNSDYGMAVHFWDGGLIKTVKLRPPNLSRKRLYAAKLMKVRDNLYNLGCITRKQLNVYSAIIRKTLSSPYKGWVKREVCRVVKKVRRMARRRGKEALVLIDKPDHRSLSGSRLQKTLLSFVGYLENLLSWYGIYWEEVRLYSTVCPRCGGKMELLRRTRRSRWLRCRNCGFSEERDKIPLHWGIKLALKGERRVGDP